jgi:hypothetical protein
MFFAAPRKMNQFASSYRTITQITQRQKVRSRPCSSRMLLMFCENQRADFLSANLFRHIYIELLSGLQFGTTNLRDTRET